MVSPITSHTVRKFTYPPTKNVNMTFCVLTGVNHLEGNFLPEGNLSLWKEIWKETAFGRKMGGNINCYKEGNEKEILFYLIISKNKAIFTQFCAKNNNNNNFDKHFRRKFCRKIKAKGNFGLWRNYFFGSGNTSDGRYQLFWFRYDTKINTDTQFFPFIKITFKTRTLMLTSQRIL